MRAVAADLEEALRALLGVDRDGDPPVLDGHNVRIHHDNGRMDFGFRETVVATVRSSPGPFQLVCERRVPLANPQGKARTGGVQPDHGLWTREGGEEVCHLAVEVKHYKKASRGKFVDVFEDYARALPRGEVHLVNHGPTGKAVYEVTRDLRSRCHAIEMLTAANSMARQEARDCRAQVRGRADRQLARTRQCDGFQLRLAIDVSGSMLSRLRSPGMEGFVRQIAEADRPGRLIAIDTRVVGAWEPTGPRFAEPLALQGGSTDLGQPVRELLEEYESVVVVTDPEGVSSMSGLTMTVHSAQVRAPGGIEVRVCVRPQGHGLHGG